MWFAHLQIWNLTKPIGVNWMYWMFVTQTALSRLLPAWHLRIRIGLTHVAFLSSKLICTNLFTCNTVNSFLHLCVFIHNLFQTYCSASIIVAYLMRSEQKSLEGLNSLFLEREHVSFHLLYLNFTHVAFFLRRCIRSFEGDFRVGMPEWWLSWPGEICSWAAGSIWTSVVFVA